MGNQRRGVFANGESIPYKNVATEIQEREINDYLIAFDKLIDSVGRPNDSNFTDIFFFLDETKPVTFLPFLLTEFYRKATILTPNTSTPVLETKTRLKIIKAFELRPL